MPDRVHDDMRAFREARAPAEDVPRRHILQRADFRPERLAVNRMRDIGLEAVAVRRHDIERLQPFRRAALEALEFQEPVRPVTAALSIHDGDAGEEAAGGVIIRAGNAFRQRGWKVFHDGGEAALCRCVVEL